jgi:hypothetical protein
MLRTITLGTCVSVQGLVVGQRSDGQLMVKVGDRVFIGTPVPVVSRPASEAVPA